MMRNGVIGSTADSDSVSRGSSPFSVAEVPYFIGVWLSLVERYVRDVEAAGSNPVTPIFLYRKVLDWGFAVFFLLFYPAAFGWRSVFLCGCSNIRLCSEKSGVLQVSAFSFHVKCI